MKLLKSSIFAAFALALTLTGCSDDENYSVGAASPGAYFPQNLDAEVTASTEASVYEVPVCRTSADDNSSYDVTYSIYPQTDAISIPSKITFSGDEVKTTLPITYDAAALSTDDVYDIVINLADASKYGDSSYSFSFQVSAPLVTEIWDGSIASVKGSCTGTGTWTFTKLGDSENYQIYKVYNPDKPHAYSIQITNWCNFLGSSYNGVPLTIEIADDTDVDEYGTIVVRVPDVNLGVDIIGDGDATHVADYYAVTGNSKYANYSYYDPATGTFYLALAWYSATSGIKASGYDTLQLDGYPDYTITAEYSGLFIDTKGAVSAIGSISTGDDVASVKAALVLTDDKSTAASYVMQGGDGVIDVTPGTDVSVKFPVTKSGSYLLTAVAYNSAGVAQDYACATAVIDLNSGAEEEDSDWKTLGAGQFVDGWMLTAWNMDATSYPVDVTIRQSVTDPTKYQIVEPYTSSSNLLVSANINECTTKRNIEFTLSGNYIEMRPQLAGFVYSKLSSSEFKIMNYEGYYAALYAAQGVDYTESDIRDQLKAAELEASTYSADDTMIEIPVCPFCLASETKTRLWSGTNGTVTQPGYILLPDAPSSARRKISAKMVAAPKFAPLSSAIKVKAVEEKMNKPMLMRSAFDGQRHVIVRK